MTEDEGLRFISGIQSVMQDIIHHVISFITQEFVPASRPKIYLFRGGEMSDSTILKNEIQG